MEATGGRKRIGIWLLFPIFVLAGCAGPIIGVNRISPQESYQISSENVLGAGTLSDHSRAVLHRYNLLDAFDENPLRTIRSLHDIGRSDHRRDLLFALSEISYLLGARMSVASSDERSGQARELFFQSAVYAHFYLLGDGHETPPTPYDRRFREACDLYNRSLWQSFSLNGDGSLNLVGGVRRLVGTDVLLNVDTDTLAWNYEQFERFFPADGYAIRGFAVHNRTPGLGLPLVGVVEKSEASPSGGALPLTAILRISGNLADYQQGKAQATLELYSALDNYEVQINGHSVPLETDITTPLAYRLNDAKIWRLGEKRFLGGTEIPVRVLLIQPYQPGRIPVVFVHGTASSPVWWAEMLNALRADPEIRKHFQFWFYQYNSGNMVVLSAAELRESLRSMVEQLDPQRRDPALQNMVVIGHSQGGLLTKMSVVDSGDTLWHAISDERFDEMNADPVVKDIARQLLFFKPLPFVKRVVYIATPHRGSYLTKDWVRWFVKNVVNLPLNLVVNSQEFLSALNTRAKLPESMKRQIPTSIDGMSEENPLLRELLSLPAGPGVTAHSIVAVKPGMDIATGNDGVVAYTSAHIDDVESELIVRADHSCQSHPFVIEEVRRILLKHIGIENVYRILPN